MRGKGVNSGSIIYVHGYKYVPLLSYKHILKSFKIICISDLNLTQTHLKMADRKAVIKNADMSEEMQQDAVDCATQVRVGSVLVWELHGRI